MQNFRSGLKRMSDALHRVKRFASHWGLGKVVAVAQRPELEQALLRVTIGGLVLLYLAAHVYRDAVVTDDEAQVLWVAIGFFVFSISLTAQILRAQSVSVARRFLGMVADNAVTSYCLIQ